ncbi:hypothetical protein [Photobacterium sp. Hal280]|uniref:hypothetical protein n=1 Tax=Photobacterium sp. Hal280 TaxID=3035163 RepID=UPI00301D65EF
MSSHLAMQDFVDNLSLKRDDYGNCTFQALVEFRSKRRNVSEITTVKFIRNGYNDGNITITEEAELTSDYYHLDFSPDWQEYSFNPNDNSLLIKGSSPKMGGKYTVAIKVA